ncbi:MAG: glycosyltransferase [Candidatus Eisenbacteria bacterium]
MVGAAARDGRESGANRARPIRVLYVIGNMKTGGSEAHLVRLLERLDRSQVEPRLLLVQGRKDLLPPEIDREVQTRCMECAKGLKGSFEFLTRIRSEVRRIAPDVVQVYGYPADVILALIAPTLPGVRVVTTRRGNEQRSRRNLSYRLTNGFIDCVLCVSKAAAAHAHAAEGLPLEKTLVIPNGIDLSRFPEPTRTKDQLRRLGAVMRLRHIKGVDLLLEAFSQGFDPPIELEIAGPADTAYGEEIMAKHEGTPGLTFLGDVSDVPSFLGRIDFFVLPSRSEGMSNALLEALAAGLPIVATDVGGNAEVLDDGTAGVLVEPTAESIRNGIQSLLDSPETAFELTHRARARAESEYSLDGMARRYEEFYRSIMA